MVQEEVNWTVVQFYSVVVVVEVHFYSEEVAADLTFQEVVVVPCSALMRLVVAEGVHRDSMILAKVEKDLADQTC